MKTNFFDSIKINFDLKKLIKKDMNMFGTSFDFMYEK